jgi:hypothetical protein
MIIINQPVLSYEDETIKLSSEIEIANQTENLWFQLPREFEKYISSENCDSFLVGILPKAMEMGYDISIKSEISSRLYYTINHYLMPALKIADSKFKIININPDKLYDENVNTGNSAGMGLSCGVDSFATYYDHIKDNPPFKIEYFTFVNAGSLGDYGGENTRKIFKEKFKQVSKFANNQKIELISIDSNISEILRMNFQRTHTFRNLSCILNLQKLFRNYYYASPHRFDQFNISSKDSGDYDLLNTQYLSTQSITFFSSAVHLNRIERTEFISNYPATYKNLDICTNSRNSGKFINCSKCDKCMRTALTLEILGKLNLYKEVFDLDIYKSEKIRFIGKILNEKNNVFSRELAISLKNSKYWSPLFRIALLDEKIDKYKKGLKKMLKSK